MKIKYFLIVNITLLVMFGCSSQSPQVSTSEPSNSAASNVESSSTSPPSNPNRNKTPSNPSVSPETLESIASGTFVGLDHPTVGEATIFTEGDRQYLELSEDFKTDAGPDLVVVLHRFPQLESGALNEGDYIALDSLKEIRGTQRYSLPEGVDFANYSSIAIWCRRFNVTFGYAPFQ